MLREMIICGRYERLLETATTLCWPSGCLVEGSCIVVVDHTIVLREVREGGRQQRSDEDRSTCLTSVGSNIPSNGCCTCFFRHGIFARSFESRLYLAVELDSVSIPRAVASLLRVLSMVKSRPTGER